MEKFIDRILAQKNPLGIPVTEALQNKIRGYVARYSSPNRYRLLVECLELTASAHNYPLSELFNILNYSYNLTVSTYLNTEGSFTFRTAIQGRCKEGKRISRSIPHKLFRDIVMIHREVDLKTICPVYSPKGMTWLRVWKAAKKVAEQLLTATISRSGIAYRVSTPGPLKCRRTFHLKEAAAKYPNLPEVHRVLLYALEYANKESRGKRRLVKEMQEASIRTVKSLNITSEVLLQPNPLGYLPCPELRREICNLAAIYKGRDRHKLYVECCRRVAARHGMLLHLDIENYAFSLRVRREGSVSVRANLRGRNQEGEPREIGVSLQFLRDLIEVQRIIGDICPCYSPRGSRWPKRFVRAKEIAKHLFAADVRSYCVHFNPSASDVQKRRREKHLQAAEKLFPNAHIVDRLLSWSLLHGILSSTG